MKALGDIIRITLVVPTFPKLSETFIVNKFLGLMSRGYRVTVVCQQLDRAAWDKFQTLDSHPVATQKQIYVAWPTGRFLAILLMVPAFVHVFLQSPKLFFRALRAGYRRFGWGLASRFYTSAKVLSSRPDLVHFEFGAIAVDKTYVAEMAGCKTVVSFRGYDLNYVGLDRVDHYEEVWHAADAIHTLGVDLWARARRRGCPEWKKHALIPPAIDTEFFKPSAQAQAEPAPAAAGSASRPLRLLSVGRLEWKKGYEYVLAAVAQLRAMGFTVEHRIVGAGDYLEAVVFCRRQLGLEECVQILGAASAGVVCEQLEWADVFVHGAVSEGFCNAVLEAQAMEVAVVTSDADGLAENVEDGVTGYVVPRRNPEAMAERLALLADGELRQRLGRAGRERVLRRYRLEDQITAFDHLYRQVLGLKEA